MKRAAVAKVIARRLTRVAVTLRLRPVVPGAVDGAGNASHHVRRSRAGLDRNTRHPRWRQPPASNAMTDSGDSNIWTKFVKLVKIAIFWQTKRGAYRRWCRGMPV